MFTRDEAVALLKKYTKNEHLVYHAYCVEAVMRRFAKELSEDEEYWGLCGLLHDIDWDMFPEQHCKKAPELLKEINAPEDVVHAICSHGWGICSDVEPTRQMEKVLYTVDELCGLVYATALMRPERMEGMEVKSVKKKWKNAKFAAGVNRELIDKGIAMLGMDKDKVIQLTIEGISSVAGNVGLA
ncbi:MAG: HDIG domain-containing protein [Spirochaetaceae bacterium]|nr:HDIG domain-containing protein [Spirochaetaceae bacterium]